MLPGETIASGALVVCPECAIHVVTQVLRSPAGFYIGTRCDCGPYTRESGYFRTHSSAAHALETGQFDR